MLQTSRGRCRRAPGGVRRMRTHGVSSGRDPAEQMPVLPRALGRERHGPGPGATARRSCGTRRARPQGAHGARRARSPSGPGAEGPGDPRCAADARHGEAAITHYPARLAPFRTNPRYPHRHGSREKGERKNVTTIHRLRRRHVQDAHLRLVAAGRPSRRMRHVSQG